MENNSIYHISGEHSGERIDRYLSGAMENTSRSHIQRLIEDQDVTVNEKPVKPNYKLKESDEIEVVWPDARPISIEAEDIPLSILYEDDDLLVVDKPKGMVVHPAPGHYSGTLVNALMYYCRDTLSGINGKLRPGIVHRIDKDTTGSIIVCKNDNAHNEIAKQIACHSIKRIYVGVVNGIVKEDSGRVDAPIGRDPKNRKRMAINRRNGKDAITHYVVLNRYSNSTYMQFELETGRTHQIRVHMAALGHPLLGDEVYGPKKCKYAITGQTLHAKTIGFVHPRTGKYIEVEAPIPEYMGRLLGALN